MPSKKPAPWRMTLAALTLLVNPAAFAGGLMLHEIATDNLGLANAGAAARAQGPSTIASNPAGLSYLQGTQVGAGAQLLFGTLQFEDDAGNDSGNVLRPIPAGSFFISHALDQHWVVGFGAYADFGLGQQYPDHWDGRYFLEYASLAGLSLVPSVGYRLNDQWSLGMGIKAMHAMLGSEAAIDQSPFGLGQREDGHYRYQASDWGYGANLGVIYSPQPGTRVGLAYTSPVDLQFQHRLQVQGGSALASRLDGTSLGLDLRVPQTATLSLYQQLSGQWALLASLNWQDWSTFGEIGIDIDGRAGNQRAVTVDAQYQDTWQLALGAQYQLRPDLRWDLGMAYDSSAVADTDRTLSLPMGAAWRLATGLTYGLNEQTEVNLGWVMVWMGDLAVDQRKALSGQRISGEFDDTWMQALSANLTWQY